MAPTETINDARKAARRKILEQMFEKRRLEEKRRRTVSLISALFSLLVASTAGFAFFSFRYTSPSAIAIPQVVSNGKYDDISLLKNDLGKLRSEMAAIQKALTISPKPLPENATMLAFSELSTQVATISGRIKSLEDAISASPEKALSIPLIRKDLEALQRVQIDEKATNKSELERLYDFNKWFFGLIGTMALSVLGIALTNVFKTPRQSAKDI